MLLLHYTYGYHNEDKYFLHQPTDLNTSIDTGNIDRFIFDPLDASMKNTYRVLLQLYYNHWLTHRDPNKNWQQNHDTFWKLFKLTAAYLKYKHHKDSFENKDSSNQTQQSTETDSILDADTLFHNMLRYYSKLAAQRRAYSTHRNVTAPVKRHIPVISHLKGKFVSFWNRFGWWRKTEPPPQRNVTSNSTHSVLYFFLNVFNRKNYTANASLPYSHNESDQTPPTFRARRLLNFINYEFVNIFNNQQQRQPKPTKKYKEYICTDYKYVFHGTVTYADYEEAKADIERAAQEAHNRLYEQEEEEEE